MIFLPYRPPLAGRTEGFTKVTHLLGFYQGAWSEPASWRPVGYPCWTHLWTAPGVYNSLHQLKWHTAERLLQRCTAVSCRALMRYTPCYSGSCLDLEAFLCTIPPQNLQPWSWRVQLSVISVEKQDKNLKQNTGLNDWPLPAPPKTSRQTFNSNVFSWTVCSP